MAFRIHDSIVCGEIDNRIKGIVHGSIWVEGRTDPITLELRGNAHPDLEAQQHAQKDPESQMGRARLREIPPGM